MKKKDKNIKMAIILNIFLLILIISAVSAWMLTESPKGELVDYNRKLIISDSDVDVKLFVLKDGEYIEQSQFKDEPLIPIKMMEPGAMQKYRFEITNNQTVPANVKLTFTKITGDIDLLKNVVTLAESSPDKFEFRMSNRLKFNETGNYYYLDFIDNLKIPAQETLILNWNISINENATNEIQETSLAIDTIMFTKP